MGRIFDRFFNRNGNEEEDKAILSATAVNVATAINTGPSANDAEARKEEGINKDMIEDEKLMAILEGLISVEWTEQVPEVNSDSTSTTLTYKAVKHQRYNPWAAALRVYVSKVLATRYIDPLDVEISKLRLRRNFLKIKRKMNPRERAMFGDFIDGVLEYCVSSLDDTKGGRKALLLKVTQKKLEVGLNRGVVAK
jgi:hypothetical protein